VRSSRRSERSAVRGAVPDGAASQRRRAHRRKDVREILRNPSRTTPLLLRRASEYAGSHAAAAAFSGAVHLGCSGPNCTHWAMAMKRPPASLADPDYLSRARRSASSSHAFATRITSSLGGMPPGKTLRKSASRSTRTAARARLPLSVRRASFVTALGLDVRRLDTGLAVAAERGPLFACDEAPSTP
jgi:hypothetical protein